MMVYTKLHVLYFMVQSENEWKILRLPLHGGAEVTPVGAPTLPCPTDMVPVMGQDFGATQGGGQG